MGCAGQTGLVFDIGHGQVTRATNGPLTDASSNSITYWLLLTQDCARTGFLPSVTILSTSCRITNGSALKRVEWDSLTHIETILLQSLSQSQWTLLTANRSKQPVSLNIEENTSTSPWLYVCMATRWERLDPVLNVVTPSLKPKNPFRWISLRFADMETFILSR